MGLLPTPLEHSLNLMQARVVWAYNPILPPDTVYKVVSSISYLVVLDWAKSGSAVAVITGPKAAQVYFTNQTIIWVLEALLNRKK